jgi:hypothetical protein
LTKGLATCALRASTSTTTAGSRRPTGVAVRGPLVDPETGDRVGSAFWDCVAMTRVVSFEPPRGSTVCTALIRLADGEITIQGPDPAGFGASVFAVTGGTALYRNARGEADVVDASDPDRTEITIRLEP